MEAAHTNPIRHIRKTVFKVNQYDFAGLAGVTQATVSRWETGELALGHEHMTAIRLAARDRDLDWDDRLFFEAPPIVGEAA